MSNHAIGQSVQDDLSALSFALHCRLSGMSITNEPKKNTKPYVVLAMSWILLSQKNI